MNEIIKEARAKLKTEASAGKFDKYAAAMKSAVVKTLSEFCGQSERFAEAVAHGGSFEECMKAVAKNCGTSLSDEEAYKRAVAFYMPDAKICVRLEIHTSDMEIPPASASRGEIIDLSAFL